MYKKSIQYSGCRAVFYASVLWFVMINVAQAASHTADVTFNFAPHSGTVTNTTASCNMAGVSDMGCQRGNNSSGDPSTTPFLYETVNINGTSYVHLVVGDEASGFAQEIYIEGAASTGNEVAGAAHGNTQICNGCNVGMVESLTGPGNASGNPSKVAMRQVLDDGGTSMEFLKDRFAYKPVVSQTVGTKDVDGNVIGEIYVEFAADMSNILYTDDTVAGAITNKVIVNDPDIPTFERPTGDGFSGGGSSIGGNFDMSTDLQYSTVSAGRFTYTDGPGTLGSEGSYEYISGDGNLNQSWEEYFDLAQNPDCGTGDFGKNGKNDGDGENLIDNCY
ncbi:MAG: hypothetical protein GXP10_08180 [Gammaproteobacteria bacterium]|nr:hypothetical protein [Gammaproteobacteria bacterium]